jgi:hypothetical protein
MAIVVVPSNISFHRVKVNEGIGDRVDNPNRKSMIVNFQAGRRQWCLPACVPAAN